MIRPVARSIGETRAGQTVGGFPAGPDKEALVDVADVTGGMILEVPRQSLPGSSFSEARNARVREGWIGRREGTARLDVGQPDNEPVLKVLTFLHSTGNNFLLRLTRTGTHILRWPGVWQRIGEGLGFERRVSFSQIYGRVFVTNGGRVREINLDKGTVKRLKSPRLDFVTSYGDRLVGGRRNSPSVWWSANLRPDDWESESSGTETLVQNTSDVADGVVGVFGLGRELMILRSRSIWVADRQASAVAPFRFAPLVDDIGCDMPYTAVRAQGGIVFASYRLGEVYFLQPSSRPQPISQAVSRRIFEKVENLNMAEGAYDPFQGEYLLGVPRLDGLIHEVWRFSFKTGAWVYDEIPPVQSLGEVTSHSPLLMIDDLEGVIDSLEGMIDDLGKIDITPRSWIFMGGSAGEVIEEREEEDLDWDGSPFEMELVTQDLGHPAKVRSFMDVMLRVKASRQSSVVIALRSDERAWTERFRLFESGSRLLRYPKPRVQGLDLRVRLLSSLGNVKLAGYSVRLLEKGIARP